MDKMIFTFPSGAIFEGDFKDKNLPHKYSGDGKVYKHNWRCL